MTKAGWEFVSNSPDPKFPDLCQTLSFRRIRGSSDAPPPLPSEVLAPSVEAEIKPKSSPPRIGATAARAILAILAFIFLARLLGYF